MPDTVADRTGARKLRLLLLRHAKSAWPPEVPDRDRPLAPRGIKAAPLMAKYMAREKLIPDLALVSDSRRTRETWDLVGSKLPGGIDMRIVPELYEATPTDMVDVLRDSGAGNGTVLLLGHNPGLQELALMLTDGGDAQARAAMTDKFPTGALAVIDFSAADWRSIGIGSGRLERVVTPRSLK